MEFGPSHYVPVLFTKAGERDALSEIGDVQKDSLTPLFVVHPIDWNFDLDQPKCSIDEHLSKLPEQLVKTWGKRDAFVDTLHVDDETLADGSHPLEWIVTAASSVGLTLIPVVTPSRSSECIAAARNLIQAGTSTEVCLRLEIDEWPLLPNQEGPVTWLLEAIGAEKSSAHLVLDLRDETARPAHFALITALQSLATPDEWTTLTVTATAMPQTPPPGRGIHELVRQEWVNYQDIISSDRYGARQPTFGDYGIAHPDPFADVDPRMLQISAKLKYTCDDKWLLARGGLFKGTGGRSGGGEEIRPVARLVSAHDEFTATHCGSEEWILAAADTGPTGAPRTWVKIGTWHHLLRVLDQIVLT